MSDSESLPSDIEELATQVVSTLLPEKSKIKYEQAYERLRKWCDEKKIKNIIDDIILFMEHHAIWKDEYALGIKEIDAQHTIEILTKLGWYSFESTTYERWDIDTLKEWCDSNCLGKYRLFYHTCLFENTEDAVKFNLVWG